MKPLNMCAHTQESIQVFFTAPTVIQVHTTTVTCVTKI